MPRSWLAGQGRLPLAFMALGLAWLAAATFLLLADPVLLASSHLDPRVVGLAHAWILGFLVTIACGAAYQLAPVALGTTLWSERLGWWHLGLHAIGVPGMVHSFWRSTFPILGIFGLAVAIGVALFALNIGNTVRQSRRRGTVAWSLALAAAWLLVTVSAGLLLAANRFGHFIPLDPLFLLRAHAHLGLIGFFVTLLEGVAFQLLPMFTLGEVRDWRPATLGLVLTQLGLLGLAPALAWHVVPLAAAFAGFAAAGIICSSFGLTRALATRKKRALDPGIRAFLRGGLGVCVAALAGVVLLLPGTPWGSAVGGFGAMTYGILIVIAGLLPCVAGMMCKIVPFLTWMRAYGPRIGRGVTPSAGALTRPGLERWALTLQQAAAAPLVIGAWTLRGDWLRAGAWILALGVALFVADMLGVLKHLAAAPDRATATNSIFRS